MWISVNRAHFAARESLEVGKCMCSGAVEVGLLLTFVFDYWRSCLGVMFGGASQMTLRQLLEEVSVSSYAVRRSIHLEQLQKIWEAMSAFVRASLLRRKARLCREKRFRKHGPALGSADSFAGNFPCPNTNGRKQSRAGL